MLPPPLTDHVGLIVIRFPNWSHPSARKATFWPIAASAVKGATTSVPAPALTVTLTVAVRAKPAVSVALARMVYVPGDSKSTVVEAALVESFALNATGPG